MAQKRVYVDAENHKSLSRLMMALKKNKTVQTMNIRVDQNFAFSVLFANAQIDTESPDALESAVQKLLENQQNE